MSTPTGWNNENKTKKQWQIKDFALKTCNWFFILNLEIEHFFSLHWMCGVCKHLPRLRNNAAAGQYTWWWYARFSACTQTKTKSKTFQSKLLFTDRTYTFNISNQQGIFQKSLIWSLSFAFSYFLDNTCFEIAVPYITSTEVINLELEG